MKILVQVSHRIAGMFVWFLRDSSGKTHYEATQAHDPGEAKRLRDEADEEHATSNEIAESMRQAGKK